MATFSRVSFEEPDVSKRDLLMRVVHYEKSLFLSPAFGLLLLAFLGSHILLQAAVHHLELALDSGRSSNFSASTLLGHDIGHLPLLFSYPCLLVNAIGRKCCK